jgi:hypothetical protein
MSPDPKPFGACGFVLTKKALVSPLPGTLIDHKSILTKEKKDFNTFSEPFLFDFAP